MVKGHSYEPCMNYLLNSGLACRENFKAAAGSTLEKLRTRVRAAVRVATSERKIIQNVCVSE